MIGSKSISLCMVTHNDSELTQRAIESVKDIVDELVIVDQSTNQKDRLFFAERAELYTLTTEKGNADFDRQFCYSLAQRDYILAMDADEIIVPDEVNKLKSIVLKEEFECLWFKFKNLISSNGTTINLQEFMQDDPHPRLWKKFVIKDNQPVPTLVWGQEAHTFPQINTQKIIFSDVYFTHHRELENVLRTHLKRGKNISQQALQVEKNFISKVLEKFGSDVKKNVLLKLPELSDYLRS